MRVCVLAAAALLIGAMPTPAAPRVTVAGGVLSIDAQPIFPFLTWEQCAPQVDDNLALGINVFLAGRCDPAALASRIAGSAYLVEAYRDKQQELTGLIGYHQPD